MTVTDLEEQLGETMSLNRETVDYMENTEQLKAKGATTTSNLLMVMIHKFLERDTTVKPDVLVKGSQNCRREFTASVYYL